MTPQERIRRYYELDPAREWSRLERHPLEFPVTFRHLERVLPPPPATILDVGGGPGRYAIPLAVRGYRVTLVDLAQAHVEFALGQAAARGVPLDAVVGDACDLSRWADQAFDAVLNLGPLYHLVDEGARCRAVDESLRVLRSGGVGAFAFLSLYAPVFDTLKHLPDATLSPEQLLSMMRQGTNRSTVDETGFTEVHFVEPFAVRPFLESRGASVVTVFGAEGLAAQSDGRLPPVSDPCFADWLEFVVATSETPAALYGSEHLVALVGHQA